MFKAALQVVLFIAGFCAVAPILPYLIWQHWAVTPERLETMLLLLPVIVWASALAYTQAFDLGVLLMGEAADQTLQAYDDATLAVHSYEASEACHRFAPQWQDFAPA